ncbi:hypothetical protein SCUP515_02956 [Seiridium cupressi]|uniref:DUF7598 domain-containing protein n=1 Tax=Seiridium unicorne TaxID=138068 RepID=A0ABR2US79_9PEZI
MLSLNIAGKGWGFIALNILRACNIIVLTTIAVSSAVLMVVAKMPDAFTFFSDIAMAFIVIVCFFLGLSEIGVWGKWFIRNWPAFGPGRGLTWLGFAMLMMGSHILGKLSDDRFTQDKMGTIFWNVCMAAGILSYIFGVTNVIMSWWFGKRQGRNLRTFRNTGETVPSEEFPDTGSSYASQRTYSTHKEKTKSMFNPFGRSKKPQISGPMHPDDIEKGFPPMDRGSPIAPEIQRPPTLQHPAMRRGSFSGYSEASGFTHI